MSTKRRTELPVETWRNRLSLIGTIAGQMAVLDEGSGHPVVMLHGIPTHSFLWRDVSRVVSLGQRVIAPDLLGFGFSDKPEEADLSPVGQAGAVLELLDALEVETFTLVGHDYGALVASEIVSRAAGRVQRVVFLNTSLRTGDWTSRSPLNPLSVFSVPGAGEVALKIARPFMLKQAFALFVNKTERLDGDTMDLYWHPFEHGFDRTLLRLARESRLDEDTFHSWKAALYGFKRPAFVIWGALDPVFRPDRAHEIVRLLSNCRYELFLHSNHFVQEDRPQALGRLIASFVEGHHDGS
jgi:2-hydroxymuconate-semialdehyde hydrolase